MGGENSWWEKQKGKKPGRQRTQNETVISLWELKLADAICFSPSLPLLPVKITVTVQADIVSVGDRAYVVEEGN